MTQVTPAFLPLSRADAAATSGTRLIALLAVSMLHQTSAQAAGFTGADGASLPASALAMDIGTSVFIGIVATLVMDLWLQVLRRCVPKAGIQGLNFALLGRWAGHLLRGQFRHTAIASAAPIRRETALGWLLHYLTGIAFAAILLQLAGPAWQQSPTLLPALLFGVVSVLIPLGVMQPAMGAGWFARRTATPLAHCLRSLINHTVFGLGLYLGASLLALFLR